jgi:uridine kinase
VALDGGSGAGKSTIATQVASALGRSPGYDVALIPLDDFYAADIPDAAWDSFSVAERLAQVFDWARLRTQVLAPLLAAERATWHAFDFAAGPRPDGTYGLEATPKVREPAAVILIEGAYSAGPALVDLVDLTVLVDVPVAVRHARLAAREEPGFLAAWHARWDAVEAYYFSTVRPRGGFDLVVGGTST